MHWGDASFVPKKERKKKGIVGTTKGSIEEGRRPDGPFGTTICNMNLKPSIFILTQEKKNLGVWKRDLMAKVFAFVVNIDIILVFFFTLISGWFPNI
jgi:hypothetical protein